jgi:hypothetical protein
VRLDHGADPVEDRHMLRAILLSSLVLICALPAAAQEAGWHYSPYDGEGDRAAMGCSTDSTPASHSCVVVRCEDDQSVAIYIETSRQGGDAGQWVLSVDGASPVLTAEAVPGSPYGARIVETDTPIPTLVEMLKLGAVGYLEPREAQPAPSAMLPMAGSLYAINQALYFCAPPADENGTE